MGSEQMVFRAARELHDKDVVFVGIGLPNLACNLARATHAPSLCLIYESGAVGAVPQRLPVSIGDPALVTDSLAVVSQGVTTTAYDALSRPTSSTAPNGERTVWTYLGRASAQWGIDRGTSNPHPKVLQRTDLDALGRPQYLRTYDLSSGALLPMRVP